MVAPEIWGSIYWKNLQRLFFFMDQQSSTMNADHLQHLYSWLEHLAFLLPCPSCREDFLKRIHEKKERDPFVIGDLFPWMIRLQNEINQAVHSKKVDQSRPFVPIDPNVTSQAFLKEKQEQEQEQDNHHSSWIGTLESSWWEWIGFIHETIFDHGKMEVDWKEQPSCTRVLNKWEQWLIEWAWIHPFFIKHQTYFQHNPVNFSSQNHFEMSMWLISWIQHTSIFPTSLTPEVLHRWYHLYCHSRLEQWYTNEKKKYPLISLYHFQNEEEKLERKKQFQAVHGTYRFLRLADYRIMHHTTDPELPSWFNRPSSLSVSPSKCMTSTTTTLNIHLSDSSFFSSMYGLFMMVGILGLLFFLFFFFKRQRPFETRCEEHGMNSKKKSSNFSS